MYVCVSCQRRKFIKKGEGVLIFSPKISAALLLRRQLCEGRLLQPNQMIKPTIFKSPTQVKYCTYFCIEEVIFLVSQTICRKVVDECRCNSIGDAYFKPRNVHQILGGQNKQLPPQKLEKNYPILFQLGKESESGIRFIYHVKILQCQILFFGSNFANLTSSFVGGSKNIMRIILIQVV